MKCPLCNATIRDGSLYCEVCGEDVHIVPDFDPTVEEACRVTIESMRDDVFKKEDVNLTNNDNNIKRSANRNIKKNSRQKLSPKKLALLIGIPVLCCVIALLATLFFTKKYYSSFEYRYIEAKNAYLSGDYQSASIKYANLLEEDKSNISLIEEYLLCLYGAGDYDEYENQLFLIYDSSEATLEQRYSALAKLVAIYDSQGEYDKIRELVLATKDESIIAGYSDYFVNPPVIYPESGDYSLSQLLSVEAEEGVDIYISVVLQAEGVETSEASFAKYDGPVLLDGGSYCIKAYSENEKGIVSDIVEADILIALLAPDKPVVTPNSGAYSDTQFIEVLDEGLGNSTVYYTTDGSDPTVASLKYSGRLLMLPGYSNYKFVCINDEGLSSEIVEVHYEFNIEYNVDCNSAINTVMQFLFEKGITISPDGTLSDGGKLWGEIVDISNVDGDNYYIIEEVSVLDDGSIVYLDVKYGVNLLSGDIIKL